MKRIKERLLLVRPLLVPLMLYIRLLAVSYTQLSPEQSLLKKVVLTSLPMLPAVYLAVGLVRAVSKLDELEKKIILEACAMTLVVTFLGLIALMLLQRVGIANPDPMYIGLGMAVLLVIGKIAGNWRHK